ncbi:TPA: hypothetical protein MJG48_19590 [Klebsiella pneumoniae]|nr:hypothetical protein [Klebsiella pneumoniae]HBZ1612449.1 hypothetical protein [Klebsiella pneumoniae]
MMREITLDQAVERAHQTEIICRLVEDYPRQLDGDEVLAIATLPKRLSGDVAAWLIEEQASIMAEQRKKGGKHA